MSISNGSLASAGGTSSTALEARLEARLEGVLEDFGQAYNSVEDRVYILESASPFHVKRIAKLEELVLPVENYGKKIQEAVGDLSDFKKKFQTFKTGALRELHKKFQIFADESIKKFDGLSKKIDEIHAADLTEIELRLRGFTAEITAKTDDMTSELAKSSAKMNGIAKRLDDLPEVDDNQVDINASVQSLLARVLKLESNTQSSTSQSMPLSTNDLAHALISRLAQGDLIDSTALAGLRAVMPGPVSSGVNLTVALPPHLTSTQEPASTVSTAEQAASRKASTPSRPRKRSLEQSNADNDESYPASQETPRPHKRGRPAKSSRSTLRKSAISSPSKQANEATRENPIHQGIEDADIATATYDAQEGKTAEIRRSARTPKPNKKHASFLTWIEVRERRKTR